MKSYDFDETESSQNDTDKDDEEFVLKNEEVEDEEATSEATERFLLLFS